MKFRRTKPEMVKVEVVAVQVNKFGFCRALDLAGWIRGGRRGGVARRLSTGSGVLAGFLSRSFEVQVGSIYYGPGIMISKVYLSSLVLNLHRSSEHTSSGGSGATPPGFVVEWRSHRAMPPTMKVDWRPPHRCLFRSKGDHDSSRPEGQKGGRRPVPASSMKHSWRHRCPRLRSRRRRCCACFGRVLDPIAFSTRLLRSSLQKLGANLYFPDFFGFVRNMYQLCVNISAV